MELLVLFSIALLIAIVVLPFIALAKANSAKRGVDDLVTRLSSLENEVRNLRPEVVPALQPEVAVAAMETVPLAVPITPVAVIVPEKESVPPPIPERPSRLQGQLRAVPACGIGALAHGTLLRST